MGDPSIEAPLAARRLLEEVVGVRPGLEVLITADTGTERQLVEVVAGACYALGANPVVVYYPMRPYPCQDPPGVIGRAARSAEVWLDLAVHFSIYSPAHQDAICNGCRYLLVGGLGLDSLVRLGGGADIPRLQDFGSRLREVLRGSKAGRVTSRAGTDFRVQTSNDRWTPPANLRGRSLVLPGQASWRVTEGSVDGRIVFDGTLWPPAEVGLLREPVELVVSGSTIVDIRGGREARVFARWLDSFGHPAMYRISHLTFGFNPRVMRPTGRIIEDERIFGCLEVGIGSARMGAPSHADGIILAPTVELDGTVLIQDGFFTQGELADLARGLLA